MLYKCLPFQLDIRRAAVRPYLPGVSSSQDADEHICPSTVEQAQGVSGEVAPLSPVPGICFG